MRKTLILTVLCFIALTRLGLADEASLVFRVTDHNDQPLADAKLTYLASPWPKEWGPREKRVTKTNENGEHVFQWNAPHEFTQFEVLVEKPGHAIFLARWEFLLADPLPETFTAKLERGISVRWHLTGDQDDPEGNPEAYLPGVTVSTTLTLKDRIGRDWKHTFESVTDQNGICYIEGIPPEHLGKKIEFTLRHPEYREVEITKTLQSTGYSLSLIGLRLPKETVPMPETVLFPELPRPDYRSIKVEHATEVETLLEMMRTYINASNTQESTTTVEGRRRLLDQLNRISIYVVFLERAGLGEDAQALIERPELNIVPTQGHFPGLNLLERTNSTRRTLGRTTSSPSSTAQEKSLGELSFRVLQAQRVPGGYRYYAPPENQTLYPKLWKNSTIHDNFAKDEAKGEEIIVFETLAKMVQKYMDRAQVRPEEISDLIKSVEEKPRKPDSSHYVTLLNFAVTVYALDRQEETDALLEKAIKESERYLEAILTSDRIDPSSAYVSVKINLVKAMVRTKRYEKAFEIMKDTKAYHDKIKAEGKNTSWDPSWDNPLQDIVRTFAYEGEVELGLRVCREMFFKESSAKLGLKYLAEALAQVDRFDEARRVNALLEKPHDSSDWIDKLEALRKTPPIYELNWKGPREKVEESLTKAKTPAEAIARTIEEIDKILTDPLRQRDFVDQHEMREFIRGLLIEVHSRVKEVPLDNEGARYYHANIPMRYRDEALREFAGMALFIGAEDEAEQWLAECRELDEALPKVQRRDLEHFFHHSGTPLHRDYPWMKYARRFMKIGDENIDKAVICLKMVYDDTTRFDGCEGILNVLLPYSENKETSREK